MSTVRSETGFLAKQSTIYAVGNVLQRITSILLLPVYTHYLTTTDYGIKEIITVTIDIASVLISTAIANALFRIYFQYEEEEQRRQVVSSAFVGIAVLGAVVIGGALLFVKPLAALVLDDAGLSLYLVLALSALWFQVQNKIAYAYLRARQQAVRVVVYSVLRLALALSLNIWFIVHVGTGVVGVLWSTLITSVVLFLVLAVPQMIKVRMRFSWPIMREMLVFGLPLVPAQLGGIAVHLSDRFFIKEMLSMGDAGIYSLGYRLGTLPSMFIVEPFNQTWMPRRYEIHKQPDHERVFGRIFTYYVACLAFAALVISVLAEDVLRVMSAPEFWQAAAVVPLIALANMTFALHYHLNLGLMLAKKTKIIGAINFSNGAFVLLLNWLLIPRFGVFGAAYATLIAFVYKISLTWFFSRRYYRPRFEPARLLRIVVTAAAIYVGSRFVDLESVGWSFAVNVLLLAIFPLFLWAGGFLDEGERDQLRRLRRRLTGRGGGPPR